MNFVVAISVTYSYILSIGLQDKIGILVNQVFKVEKEIPEKQTKSKTVPTYKVMLFKDKKSSV